MEPQLRQVIIEAWRDVADVDRRKQVKKISDITCILPSTSPLPPLSIPYNTSRLFTAPYFFVRSFRYTASYRHSYLVIQMYRGQGAGVRNYSQSTIQEHRRAYSWWNSRLPETLGSLINYDGNGDGYENVTWKVNPRCFKFCQAYSTSFSSLNVGELV